MTLAVFDVIKKHTESNVAVAAAITALGGEVAYCNTYSIYAEFELG